MASSPITLWQIHGETMQTVTDVFFWAPKSLQSVTAAMKLKDTCSLEGKLWSTQTGYYKAETLLCQQRSSQSQGSSSSTYGYESWTIKKAECQRIDAFELRDWRRLLRVPWTTRRSYQSILKEICSEGQIGRTDAKAQIPKLWLPDAKNWLTGKDPDAGKDWRWEKKGTSEDEMVRWHHWLDGHEFEYAPEVGEGLGGPACCSPWGHK